MDGKFEFIMILAFIYRDSHIFSDTLDKSLMVNWFIWPWSLLNTKFTLILYPHILKISLRLSNYGSRYSLANNQRSNSEITHPHCLAFMREKIDTSSILSLNNLIKINTWILTWCRNQTRKNYFWRQSNLVSHYHWCQWCHLSGRWRKKEIWQFWAYKFNRFWNILWYWCKENCRVKF